MHRIEVHRIPTLAPDDVTGLRHLIDAGTVDPAEIICVLGKTEGNGCVNDWSRGFATVAYTTLIAERLRVPAAESRAARSSSCPVAPRASSRRT